MSDVKWIKIVTDIFDDEKILLIESMPDADAVLCIWFKVLCLAGKVNTSGVLILNDRIPFTDEMLATIFRRPVSTTRMALKTFEAFGMIEVIGDTITIPNWGKHQTLDAIESKRTYMRTYMQERREKQRQIASKSCKTNSETNSKANVRQADKERDSLERDSLERDMDIAVKKRVRNPVYVGEFGNVVLSVEEMDKLNEKLGYERTGQMIERLSGYIASKGVKYKSHYATILNWANKDGAQNTGKQTLSERVRDL